MTIQDVEAKVIALCEPIAVEEGCLLWDVILTQDCGQRILRVMIEGQGRPITVGDCTRLSRSIEDLLEVQQLVMGHYHLEVSSPGLDRPLRTEEQFKKYLGEMISVQTDQPVEGRKNFKGALQKVMAGHIEVEVDGQNYLIPFQAVRRAKLELKKLDMKKSDVKKSDMKKSDVKKSIGERV